jgi:branched-chain amino acid transport system substrate-binding protein
MALRAATAGSGVAVFLALAAGQARAADLQPVEVIAAFNLTGGSAVLDAPSYDGARLAAEAINRDGGIFGRPLELIPVDTGSKPDTVAAKVEAALAAHPGAVAGIGYSYSTEALNAGRVFQAHGLPFVSPGATDPSVPAEVGDDMFYAAYGDDAQAAAMAAFVRNELKLGRAAVWIEDRDLYPRTVGADFPKSFEALGGTVAVAQADPTAAGFAAFIDKVKAASPPVEAIYVASMPDTAPGLIAAARTAGISAPLLSGDGWDAETIVALSRDKSLGDIFFTTHNFLGVHTPAMTAFVQAYGDKYGVAPPNAFAPLGFDTVNLLADAMRRAGSTEPAAIRAALAETTDFPGIVGVISYTPGVRVPRKEVSVIEVRDGTETLRWVAPAE